MSCFLLVLQRMNNVKYNFIMLKNEMESYVRIGGGFEKSYVGYPYMGVGRGVKNCQNHPYVINEWPQVQIKFISIYIHKEYKNIVHNWSESENTVKQYYCHSYWPNHDHQIGVVVYDTIGI